MTAPGPGGSAWTISRGTQRVDLMSNAPPERDEAPRRFADSPAPWILAFGVAALVGLVAIAPKHRARQERLERMAQTREGIWYDKASPAAPLSQATASEPKGENPAKAESPVEERPTPLEAGAIEEPIPTDGDSEAAARRETSPVAIFIALSLAAVAAGLGLMSYLRSVSRDRPRRAPRNES